MATPAWRSYTDAVERDLGYLATWTPDRSLVVGDVVEIRDDRSLEHQTTLKALGIDFNVGTETERGLMHYASSSGVSVKTTAGAEVAGAPGGGGASLSFDKAGAAFFRLEGSRERSIEDLLDVKNEVRKRSAEANWADEWLVITHVVEAKRGLVLVSSSRSGSAELRANAELPGDVAGLVAADAALQLESHSNLETVFLGENGTPLYRAVRVRRSAIRSLAPGSDRTLD